MIEENRNNENKAIVKPDAPKEWGDRQEVAALATRLKTMLPNGQQLTDDQAFAAAQYAQLTKLDPFAAGFHVMPRGGITHHFAVLVNWAQGKAPFSDQYEVLSDAERKDYGIADADTIAFKCLVLRDDRLPTVRKYVQFGASFREAVEMVAAVGIGVVTKKDRTGKNGPIDPPKTWTWEKVAQKRALRNALALSHGKPTAQELRAIGQQLHRDSDEGRLEQMATEWKQITDEASDMTPEEHARRLDENVTIMRGPEEGAIGDDYDDSQMSFNIIEGE